MKWLVTIAVLTLLCGCLSVVRIPLCDERVSDEGEVTNRVWHSFCDDVPGMRVYPTVKMRCRVTAEWLKPIPPDVKGEQLRQAKAFKHWGWIPLGVIWLTVPFDAAIDTVFLPWDLYCRKEAVADTVCLPVGRPLTAARTGGNPALAVFSGKISRTP